MVIYFIALLVGIMLIVGGLMYWILSTDTNEEDLYGRFRP